MSTARLTNKLLFVRTATRATNRSSERKRLVDRRHRSPQSLRPLILGQRAAQAFAKTRQVGVGIHDPAVSGVFETRFPDRLRDGRRGFATDSCDMRHAHAPIIAVGTSFISKRRVEIKDRRARTPCKRGCPDEAA